MTTTPRRKVGKHSWVWLRLIQASIFWFYLLLARISSNSILGLWIGQKVKIQSFHLRLFLFQAHRFHRACTGPTGNERGFCEWIWLPSHSNFLAMASCLKNSLEHQAAICLRTCWWIPKPISSSHKYSNLTCIQDSLLQQSRSPDVVYLFVPKVPFVTGGPFFFGPELIWGWHRGTLQVFKRENTTYQCLGNRSCFHSPGCTKFILLPCTANLINHTFHKWLKDVSKVQDVGWKQSSLSWSLSCYPFLSTWIGGSRFAWVFRCRSCFLHQHPHPRIPGWLSSKLRHSPQLQLRRCDDWGPATHLLEL